jgi:hypothetical protein
MTDVAAFFASHPELRRAMADSVPFSRVKANARVEIDDEILYVVKGDILGEEEELFVETVIRGAKGQDELQRDVFDQLQERDRELILSRFRTSLK